MDERNCRNLHNETIQAVRCPKVFIDLPQSGLSKTGPPKKTEKNQSLDRPQPFNIFIFACQKVKIFHKKIASRRRSILERKMGVFELMCPGEGIPPNV
jgi:hypothetical protein